MVGTWRSATYHRAYVCVLCTPPRDLSPRLCAARAVVPRPIALTSTKAPDGTVNLAPFSYFNTVGHDPPTLAISICRNGDGTKKDTLVNIEANGWVAR